MAYRAETVRTADCPCGGKHAWMWHKDRGLQQCEYSRDLKYKNYKNWKKNVERDQERRRKALAEDPARVPWIAGAPIFVDEEEHAA